MTKTMNKGKEGNMVGTQTSKRNEYYERMFKRRKGEVKPYEEYELIYIQTYDTQCIKYMERSIDNMTQVIG